MLYNNVMEGKDIWEEVSCFFVKTTNKTQHMNLTKFYTEDKFGLLFDLRSMEDQAMHGSGTHLVNTKDGVQLGSGNMNCHVFVISDTQINIKNRQLESVQYQIVTVEEQQL